MTASAAHRHAPAFLGACAGSPSPPSSHPPAAAPIVRGKSRKVARRVSPDIGTSASALRCCYSWRSGAYLDTPPNLRRPCRRVIAECTRPGVSSPCSDCSSSKLYMRRSFCTRPRASMTPPGPPFHRCIRQSSRSASGDQARQRARPYPGADIRSYVFLAPWWRQTLPCSSSNSSGTPSAWDAHPLL